MEQNKKNILKKKIANVAPTPGEIVGGAAKSAYGSVVKAVKTAAGYIPGKIKAMSEPVRFDRSTYKAPEDKALKAAYPKATKTGTTSTGVEVYSNLEKKVRPKVK